MAKTKIILLSTLIGLIGLTGCDNTVEFSPGKNNESNIVLPPPPAGSVSETFKQTASSRKVDILMIIDNSGSMAVDQTKLGAKFSNFISHLKDVDWQIGITTTDVSSGAHGLKGSLVNVDGTGRNFITKDDANSDQLFLNTVVREETNGCITGCPSGDEQPLAAAILAMEKHNTANDGFFRENSDLALVVLSDEDEYSSGEYGATEASEVISTFDSVWPQGQMKALRTYGIAIIPGDQECFKSQNDESLAYYATHLSDLVMQTNGIMGSICEDDFGPTLSEIGLDVKQLVDHVELTQEPAPETVKVTLSPADPSVTWELDGRRINFENPPKNGTDITVVYVPQSEMKDKKDKDKKDKDEKDKDKDEEDE